MQDAPADWRSGGAGGLFAGAGTFTMAPMRGRCGWKRAFRGELRKIAGICVCGLVILIVPPRLGAEIEGWTDAIRPFEEGLPQVAAMRLRAILSRDPPEPDKTTVTA